MTLGQMNNLLLHFVEKKKINQSAPVLISLKDPSTCGNVYSGIKRIDPGKSWHGSLLMVEPDVSLYKSNFRTDYPAGWAVVTQNGKRVIQCSRCGKNVDPEDLFCRSCGQRLQ